MWRMNILNSVPQYYVLIHIRRKIVYHNLLKFCFLHKQTFVSYTNKLYKILFDLLFTAYKWNCHFSWSLTPPTPHSKNVFPPYQSLPTWCHPKFLPPLLKKNFSTYDTPPPYHMKYPTHPLYQFPANGYVLNVSVLSQSFFNSL